MKKLSITLLSLISTLAFPAVSLAGCDTSGSCTNVTVDRFYPDSNGLFIDTSDNEKNLNCQPISGKYLKLPITNSNYALISTVLLTAHESQYPIWIRLNDGTGECTISYVVSDK